MLIDNGANADARPEFLLQFAQMGSLYVERVWRPNPAWPCFQRRGRRGGTS